MRRAFLLTVMLLGTMPAWAGSPYNDLTEAQKRKIVVPDIRQLTYCLAHDASADPDAVVAYRSGQFSDYIRRQLGRCQNDLNQLVYLYEETYGEGQAESFIKGPYLNDLPRAVLSLIRTTLDAEVADQQRSEQMVRADLQLPGLVESGEAAEVLANTAMTICSKPLDDAMDSAVAVVRAKGAPETQGVADDVLKVDLKGYVKERVVADAVQAKAGVGAFANTVK